MLTDELKQFIGRQYPPHIRIVEEGAIKRYAEAVGDDNPLFLDEEFARGEKYQTVIAPPGFFGWPRKGSVVPEAIMEVRAAIVRAGYSRFLDGGISYDFCLPICAGDMLVTSMKVKDIYEREGKTGTLIFAVFETSYINQNGNLVARAYHTLIAR
jgi:acyl dehydratase